MLSTMNVDYLNQAVLTALRADVTSATLHSSTADDMPANNSVTLPPIVFGSKRPQPIQPLPPLPTTVLAPSQQVYMPLLPYTSLRPIAPSQSRFPLLQDVSYLNITSPIRLPMTISSNVIAGGPMYLFPAPSSVEDGQRIEEEDDDMYSDDADIHSVAGSLGNPSSVQEINVVDVLDEEDDSERDPDDLLSSLATPQDMLFSRVVESATAGVVDDLSVRDADRVKAETVFDFILHSEAAPPTTSMSDVSPSNDVNTPVTMTTTVATLAPVTNNVIPHRPTYRGMYCVDCNQMYPGSGCTQHTAEYQCIEDSPVCSRARRSVPAQLRLRSINNCTEPNCMGVVTVEAIARRTRLGPLVGIKTRKEDLVRPTKTAYVWELFDDDGPSKVLDCRDEERSNWLMFVKRARSSGEQNVMVCQQGERIVFVTSRDVPAHTELLYWYARDYAQMLGVATCPEDFLACAQCGMWCRGSTDLAAHMRLKHSTTSTPTVPPYRLRCELCARQFVSACKLHTHMHAHLGVKPHACTHCAKRFTDASNLRMHMRLHTDERKFTCSECGRAFRQKSHLLAHAPVHSGVRASQCRYCERMFARASDARMHERMHTRERTHTCTHDGCGKVFWKVQNYKRHLLVHQGIREHACTHCEKAFASRYHMRRHLAACKGTKQTEATSGDKETSTSPPKS